MDKIINSPEDQKIQQLVESLGSHDGMERKKARGQLVSIGKDTLPLLCRLVNHPKYIQRWEALKTMEEIGDTTSIPMFIEAMEDHERDIRWIAAEGLIKLGQQSIKPILETLVVKSDSVFVLSGAHHVFHDLKKEGKLPDGFPVDELLSLLEKIEWKGAMLPMVSKLLNNL